jgi:hypothetical protein
MNLNEHEQNQTSASESQTRTETSKRMETSSDEHEGQPVQPSRDRWAGTNGDDYKWAAVSMNEWQQAQMRASEHEWELPKWMARQAWKSMNKWQQHHHHHHHHQQGQGQGQVVAWMAAVGVGAMGMAVVWVTAAAEAYYLTPCSPLSPLFYSIFHSIYMYIIIYFKYFNEKKLIPKMCNIIINQIIKIINT